MVSWYWTMCMYDLTTLFLKLALIYSAECQSTFWRKAFLVCLVTTGRHCTRLAIHNYVHPISHLTNYLQYVLDGSHFERVVTWPRSLTLNSPWWLWNLAFCVSWRKKPIQRTNMSFMSHGLRPRKRGKLRWHHDEKEQLFETLKAYILDDYDISWAWFKLFFSHWSSLATAQYCRSKLWPKTSYISFVVYGIFVIISVGQDNPQWCKIVFFLSL